MLEYQDIFEKDYEPLTHIITEAFDDDTRRDTPFLRGGPKGYDDGSLIRKLNENPQHISKKIIYFHKIIGAYTLIPKDDVYNLEMIFIDPHYNCMGIGTRIWKDIEETYPNVKTWYIETPFYSSRNHHFFVSKCGFQLMRKKRGSNGFIRVYKKESYFTQYS